MIRPGPGVAFTWADDGDQLGDRDVRRAVASAGAPDEWATVRQVHGAGVLVVDEAGTLGDADALVVTRPGLAAAVFTADCLGVVLVAEGAVGVAHAGWRGLAEGVIDEALSVMASLHRPASRAYLGPHIGPCCFEVGDEVAERFPQHHASTTWGTRSVDLAGEAVDRLVGLDVWHDGRCTMCGGGLSHRRTGAPERMAAVGWVS